MTAPPGSPRRVQTLDTSVHLLYTAPMTETLTGAEMTATLTTYADEVNAESEFAFAVDIDRGGHYIYRLPTGQIAARLVTNDDEGADVTVYALSGKRNEMLRWEATFRAAPAHIVAATLDAAVEQAM